MRRGTGFLLGYGVVGIIRAFIDIICGCFKLLIAASELAVRSIDHAPGRREAFERTLRQVVDPYMPTLVAKRSKLLVTDDYGVLRNEHWSKELGHFIGKVLHPKLGSSLPFAQRNLPYVAGLLDDMIAAEQRGSRSA